MDDLQAYIGSVAESVRRAGAEPQDLDVGQYEGLTSKGTAPLRPRPGETERHHSGVLLGHLIRWTHARGRPLDAGIVGLTTYASAIAHAEAQRLLAQEEGLLKAHQYAAGVTERHRTAHLDEQDEVLTYAWLCALEGQTLTNPMVERLLRLRRRRHERARERRDR